MLQFFCKFILFSYINVCFELCGESHFRATIYKFTLDWIEHFPVLVTFVIFLYFYTLIFHVLVKSHGKVGVLKYNIFCLLIHRKRKRSDSVLWQKPLHQQKCQKGKVTTQTTPQKSSIKQRLRTDLGRSVGVTTATQLVWLTGLRAHLRTNRNSRLIKRTHV